MALLDPITALLSAVLILGVLASTPVRAQVLASADGDKVRLELRGRVAPRCSLSGMPSAIDLGRIIPGGGELRRDFAFQVDCNTPFTYAMVSGSAAMRRSADGRDDHAGSIPYRARLTITTDSGGRLSLDCTGQEIAAEAGTCRGLSGDEIAIRKDAVLAVSWAVPDTSIKAGFYTAPIHLELGVAN
jgi:hypothetical protein